MISKAGDQGSQISGKKALILGITGQDGTYLSELLVQKGYQVHGLQRPSSLVNTGRIDHLLEGSTSSSRIRLHYGDLTESTSIIKIIKEVEPDEIYNLGAQSHVAVSFQTPEYSINCDGLGALRLLDAIRLCGLQSKTRVFQASSCLIFRENGSQMEYYPKSPYATAKLYAYWITVNYREAYGIFACNGVLFSHESPLRGENFVARKITRGLARIKLGLQDCLFLGNLNARRDWGHARDFVEMFWRMLQQDIAKDYVIATGEQHSLQEFIQVACEILELPIEWSGIGLDTKGLDPKTRKPFIAIDPKYFRPADNDSLVGDAQQVRQDLQWQPKTSFRRLIVEMVEEDLRIASGDGTPI
jgi:GDPmannose 4,6-dehydratase